MSERDTMSIAAVSDFRRARQRAMMEDIFATLTGRPSNLLSYDEVKQKLRATISGRRELTEIPLDAIVGSVGRYTDFTRQFLPRKNSDEMRWAKVKSVMEGLTGVPPIEVYQVGTVYFVLDGNHRVSIMRQNGVKSIQAYVTQVHSRVPLSPYDSPDDLIIKAEYSSFLEHTQLDEAYPSIDLRVTEPGQYAALAQEIEDQRAMLAAEQKRAVTFAEAAVSWYEQVYLLVIAVIRRQGLLHDFPSRTETDMYGWIARHRTELEAELGWNVTPAAVASDLVSQHSSSPRRVAARLGERLLGVVTPAALETGPRPGDWRKDRDLSLEREQLTVDLLVPISGEAIGWYALDQAIVIAQHEGGRIAGLHVVSRAEARNDPATQAVQAEFDRRCQAAGVHGNLVLEVGTVTALIADRARWSDLVVVNLAYPPGAEAVARLRSGFRSLIQRCPRPILAVPQVVSPLRRALLAYDGSPKSQEALYIGAYLALRWQIPLIVVSVRESAVVADDSLTQAQAYLDEHHVNATYLTAFGQVADTILRTAEIHSCDFILMGGYGFSPLLEIVIGSAVDQVLRQAKQPVLICR